MSEPLGDKKSVVVAENNGLIVSQAAKDKVVASKDSSRENNPERIKAQINAMFKKLLGATTADDSRRIRQEMQVLLDEAGNIPGFDVSYVEAIKARVSTAIVSAEFKDASNTTSRPIGTKIVENTVPTVQSILPLEAIKKISEVVEQKIIEQKINTLAEVKAPEGATERQKERSQAITIASVVVLKEFTKNFGEQVLSTPSVMEKRGNMLDTFMGETIRAQMDVNNKAATLVQSSDNLKARKERLANEPEKLAALEKEVEAKQLERLGGNKDLLQKKKDLEKSEEAPEVKAAKAQEIIKEKEAIEHKNTEKAQVVTEGRSKGTFGIGALFGDYEYDKVQKTPEEIEKLKEAGKAVREQREAASKENEKVFDGAKDFGIGSLFDEGAGASAKAKKSPEEIEKLKEAGKAVREQRQSASKDNEKAFDGAKDFGIAGLFANAASADRQNSRSQTATDTIDKKPSLQKDIPSPAAAMKHAERLAQQRQQNPGAMQRGGSGRSGPAAGA